MSDREKIIAEAAARAYAKYGVKRATMSDIAKEAGVARQTVYNVFPNTDAVLRAAIRHFIAELWQKICAGWQDCDTLDQKLDILFQHFAIEPWEYVTSSEEAAELERGYNEAGRAEIDAAREGFHDDIAALFAPFTDNLSARGIDPLAVANFISFAIEGIKYNSATRDDLLRHIATLKAAVLALTEKPR